MTFSGKHLTKADLSRREAIHAGNCMACEQLGIDVSGQGVVQWHHTEGKQHHDRTVGLSIWHHQAIPFPGRDHAYMREHYGPSLAEGSKPFVLRFGTGPQLLARQNAALDEVACA